MKEEIPGNIIKGPGHYFIKTNTDLSRYFDTAKPGWNPMKWKKHCLLLYLYFTEAPSYPLSKPSKGFDPCGHFHTIYI